MEGLVGEGRGNIDNIEEMGGDDVVPVYPWNSTRASKIHF